MCYSARGITLVENYYMSKDFYLVSKGKYLLPDPDGMYSTLTFPMQHITCAKMKFLGMNSAWLPGKYSSPEKKSVKSLIYIGAVERTCLSRCCGGAADLEVLNRLMSVIMLVNCCSFIEFTCLNCTFILTSALQRLLCVGIYFKSSFGDCVATAADVSERLAVPTSALLKQVPAQALSAAQQAPVVARSVASEVKRAGVYEPKAEQCAVSTWRKLNQLPLFPQVAQVFVPTAAYCSEKYNETVLTTAEKGYRVSTYLPLVPTKRIAKVFSNEVAESQPLVSAGHETDVSVQ
ncbi:hypothetical protein Pint_19786 [Pistacia integerrima]|uniref:Uncharacterized protein n=1 Tax=Pistacia integerrima TaxID=434235 RepID=A0ACC0XDA1_9ROSI|nr:hypothetical protein Pint_19786 [Pistacia integerrima]